MGRIVSDACNEKHFGEVTTSTKDVRKNSVEDICLASFLRFLTIREI